MVLRQICIIAKTAIPTPDATRYAGVVEKKDTAGAPTRCMRTYIHFF